MSPSHKQSSPQHDSYSSTGRWRDALGVGSRVDTSNEDHLCKVLAIMVDEELDMYQRVNPNWPEPSVPVRPQSVLLITDRTMDMIAPFVHEFTYQAMANDLLPITNGTKFRCVSCSCMAHCHSDIWERYEFTNSQGAMQTANATLSDADALWVQTRHSHIKETIDTVIGELKAFQESHGVFSKS